MSTCITFAGEALIASLQAQGQPLVIDTMIFADVPDLDPAQPASRTQAVPSEHVVHTAQIPPEFRAFVNPNQVVYSVLLGSDVGDFSFNWQGLYCSEHDVLIAVAELPGIEKRANDAGTNTPGNNLTRNFMLQFTGAQELTGVTVEAEVWQLDFTVRLKGVDERERLSNRDIYGRAAFLQDGWLLVNNGGNFHFKPGTAYAEGIRATLGNILPTTPAPLPCDVYLDVCLAPQGSDVVTVITPRFVAEGTPLPDYAEGAPFHTPHYCVQIAHVAADGTVTDLRPKDLPLFTGRYVPIAGTADLTGAYSMAPLDLGTDSNGTVQIDLSARNTLAVTVNHGAAIFADPIGLTDWPGGEITVWITMTAGAAFAGRGSSIVEVWGGFDEMLSDADYIVTLRGRGDGIAYAFIDEVA